MYCYILQKCSGTFTWVKTRFLGAPRSNKRWLNPLPSQSTGQWSMPLLRSLGSHHGYPKKSIFIHQEHRYDMEWQHVLLPLSVLSSQSCVSFEKKTHKIISSLGRDKAENHYIEAQFIPDRDQVSNVLTNPLTCNKFNYTLEASSMCCYRPLSLKGRVQNNGMGQINQKPGGPNLCCDSPCWRNLWDKHVCVILGGFVF